MFTNKENHVTHIEKVQRSCKDDKNERKCMKMAEKDQNYWEGRDSGGKEEKSNRPVKRENHDEKEENTRGGWGRS